jgi:anaerobic selenocysteine-containing dehydrogenase
MIIHSKVAEPLGISDQDPVVIETKRGKIKQSAKLSEKVDPRVMFVDPGWWFPEKGENKKFLVKNIIGIRSYCNWFSICLLFE